MDEIPTQDTTTDIKLLRTIDDTVKFHEIDVNTMETSHESDDDVVCTYQRQRSTKSCPTLMVGDQGTNKVIHGVKGRSQAAYGWCVEVPGDMHAKGYLYEVCKKVMTPEGFMHILQDVLSRQKITADSFAKGKFEEQNLVQIEEAVHDTAMAFGIAAVFEFESSNSFPNADQLQNCKRATGSYITIVLENLKKWISHTCEDVAFKYYFQMFTLVH